MNTSPSERDDPTVRRFSLKKSKQHLYYRIDEAQQVVQVWHHNRGAPPKL